MLVTIVKIGYFLVQVENENERTIPPTVEESFENEGDGLFVVDEDMKVSPSLPLIEFHELDNIIGFAGAEDVGDDLRLKRRPCLTDVRGWEDCLLYNAKVPIEQC